jgi:hypothetical protein
VKTWHLFARARLAAIVMPLALGGCCLFESCPLPGFTGIPEFVARSADIALPLDITRRATLVAFLAQGDRQQEVDPQDQDPSRAQKTDQRFTAVLDLLMNDVSDKQLQTGGTLAALADVPGRVLTVHDARIRAKTLDDDVVAIVRDGFAFAFYRQRVVGEQCAAGTAWSLAAPRVDFRTAVCAFPAVFAVPKAVP